MKKVFQVALREFTATVATKGFIFGILVTPAIFGLLALVLPLLINRTPPEIEGELAILDPTGEVIDGVTSYLAPEEISRRAGAFSRKARAALSGKIGDLPQGTEKVAEKALEQAFGPAPRITIVRLAPDADLEEEKARLLNSDGGMDRLAVALVHPDAVQKGPDGYGAYDLFVPEKLDERLEDEIQDGLRNAISAARIRIRGLDREEIDALTHVRRARPTAVTDSGEQKTNKILNTLLPMGFMMLLFISVITGGQYLMTSTVEEKSSRVVEVLLSALSPMQLMSGKILGQLAVGLVILIIYAGMAILALFSFALLGFIDLSLFFYLLIFYLIAYCVMGSLMAAVGAAVNEMSEAQALLGPIMIVMILPWLLWFPISRDPNSTFAVITSFLPPINTFVMLLRMTSSAPPPTWQVWLTIAIGALSVYACVWLAAKVFRVGLLMYGKPPNLRTLFRWIRMA